MGEKVSRPLSAVPIGFDEVVRRRVLPLRLRLRRRGCLLDLAPMVFDVDVAATREAELELFPLTAQPSNLSHNQPIFGLRPRSIDNVRSEITDPSLAALPR
jgi:hypothetical protein